ncbi:MAG: DUF4012 domain-containing protein [Patescibacteria group bacterium]
MSKKSNNQINFLEVSNDERSSRFVVDLASNNLEEDREEKKDKKIKQIFEKIIEFDFKEFWLNSKIKFTNFKSPIRGGSLFNLRKDLIKTKEITLNTEDSSLPQDDNEPLVLTEDKPLESSLRETVENNKTAYHFSWKNLKIAKWYKAHLEKYEQLAFFSLIKLIVILVSKVVIKTFVWSFKICYFAGWLFMYIIRLFSLIFIYIFKLIPVNKTFEKTNKQLNKIKFLINNFIQFFHRIKARISLLILEKVTRSSSHYVNIKDFVRLKISSGLQRDKKSKFKEEVITQPNEIVVKKIFKFMPLKLRPVLIFSLILIILILPFKAFTYYRAFNLNELKGEVMGVSEEAIGNLKSATKSVAELDFNQADDNFSQAGDNFIKAQKQLDEINGIFFSLAKLAPNEQVRLASASREILAAGQEASDLGSNLSLALASLFNNKDKDILEIIDYFTIYGNNAIKDAKELNYQLNKIDNNLLPEEYKEYFLLLKEKVQDLEKGLFEFVGLIDKLKLFLGENQNKRYLLIFQNNTELRATGGFIGSYALVDISEGKIKNLEVPTGGSYDTEGGLTELVASPEPLHLVNPLWHFWDANWWPDWPTSARKLMWFYEKSDGPTVDGVISFTPTVIEKILEAIGPIDMTENYGVTITAENFWLMTQEITENKLTPEQIKLGKDHEPKKIIGDLLEKIIDEIPTRLNQESLIKLLSAFEASISEKHILFYFVNEELQKKIGELGWDGRFLNTNWDYLAVINTNIAGGKSDKRMNEEINLVTEVMPNGSLINTLKIERTHSGIKNEPFAGVRNVNWMRIYVPLGSELLEAQGFSQPDKIYFEEPDPSWQKDPDVYKSETMAKEHELSKTKIYNENNKTVFANWSMVDPGESATIYIKYKLPFSLVNENEKKGIVDKLSKLMNPAQKELYPYAILVQKQAGAMPSQINLALKLADNFKIAWKYPKSLINTADGWQINDQLNIDKYWAVLVENK